MKNKKVMIKRMLSVVMAGTLVLGSFDIPGEVSAVKAADTMENETKDENNSGIQLQAEEDSTAVSGKDGDLSWDIDEDGLLTITGSGDYSSTDKPEWCSYADRIKEVTLEVSNITNMSSMFSGCSGLTSLDLSGLDTSKVTDMSYMFYGCSGLTSLDVSGWDTSNVTNMRSMFLDCSGLTSLDVSGWDTSKVTDIASMFIGCSDLASLDVSGWDTSNVTDMSLMFYDCSGLMSLDVSGWDTSSVTYMSSMFLGCSGLTSLDVSGFNTSNVTTMGNMFYGCSGLTSLDVSGFDTSNVIDMEWMFYNCSNLMSLDVRGFDTSKVTDMWGMFKGCSGLTSLDVGGFDTSNVTNMGSMFYWCSRLTSLDVSGLDTSNVTFMEDMFYGCSSLTSLDVRGFDTSKVTDMGGMFESCSGLTSIDVSGWDTSNVTDMGSIFYNCSGLTSIDVGGWDTSNVTNMGYMFLNCSGLTSIDVSGWNTSSVTYMREMFSDCSGLTKIIAPANLKLSIDLPTGSWFNETGESCTTIAAGLAKSMTYTRTDTEETESVVISGMTIADTYYSVDGKLPLYVEYFTTEKLEGSQYQNLELTVTKEDGTVVEKGVTNRYYVGNLGSFEFEECKGVEIGKTYPLTFVIKDTSSGKELFKETKEVGFEEKDAWADCAYLPTEETNYNIILYLAGENAIADSVDRVDGVYLVDKDHKVAAGTKDTDTVSVNRSSWSDPRYDGIFKNSVTFDNWKYCYMYSYLYRTRELKNKEVFYAAYSIDGEMHYLDDVTVTVTDQPYITGISNDSLYYPGEENAVVTRVTGSHVDFSKLSVVLKDPMTGDIVGSSVSSMTKPADKKEAFYTIKWKEDVQPAVWSNYKVEYQYSDDQEKLICGHQNQTIRLGNVSDNIIWNPKQDSIEYYNKMIPAGIETDCEVWSGDKSIPGSVCYASRNGIKVSSEHLITVPLKETFGQTQTYYLYVTYKNSESEEVTVSNSVFIYANKKAENGGGSDGNNYIIYSYLLDHRFYLSNDEKPEFSAELFCNDTSKLKAACSASIYNNTENQSVGNIELALKDNNGTLSYQGAYDQSLKPGRYQLSFIPDGGNIMLSYDFYVEDSDRLSVRSQSNDIVNGEIRLYFAASNIADWYCNEENQKKIKVKLLDIQKQEIGTYECLKDFTVTGTDSNVRCLQFNDTIKKELADRYFCYVYVSYDDKEIAVSFDYNHGSGMKSLYEYGIYNAEYQYSENSSHIYISYRSGDLYDVNGKTTYDRVYGSASAFPATVKVTDWYSLKTVKEISVPNSGYQFTEEDLEGLSSTKVYHFFVLGADGCADSSSTGYVDVIYGDQFFTKFSKVYPMSGDFDVTFEFTNKSKGINNWDNYLVCFANVFEQVVPKLNDNPGYKEYYVLRADAYGWSAIPNKTLEGNEVTYEFDWEWEEFLNMIKDSKVTMNIKRVGNDFTVDAKIKGADAKDYTYKTMFTTAADKDMTIFFTNENADVSILSFQDNKEVQPPIEDDNTGNNGNNNNNNNTNNGGTVVVPPQPEITKPAEETKPEETPSEDTNKEETPEETPSEDTNKEEETPEKTPAEDTDKEDTKEPEKEENKEPEKDKTNTRAKGKLTLKKTKLVINKGQKAKIKITSKLNTKVAYRSLNKKVAAVSSKGVVTAKKKGKAVIVVKANGKRRKVTVTVKGASAEAKNGVKLKKDFSLSVSKAVLKKGSKLEIQQASGISGKVTYRSLNKKIASVSAKGMIKARKKGKAVILIANGKKTIKLKITVTI